MNPSNTCGGPLSAAVAAPCRPAERTERCGKQKWEPQNKNQLVCSTNICKIYGTHDTQPMPEYPCPARRLKTKTKNTLGSPLGMVASNVNFKTEGKPADIAQARYATYLKAFARLHLNPETMWTSDVLDDIMREGLALYTASEKRPNKLDSSADIYTDSEKQIQREFELSGCKFQVELMKKFQFKKSPSAETNGAKGDGSSPRADEVPLAYLKSALRSFLRQHKHCLLALGSVYILLWRSKGMFFVLDVCGRRLMDFHADREKGMAMLMCLRSLENVRHLLLALTSLHKVEGATLREIRVVKLTMPSGGVVQRDYGLRVQQFEIINEDYAYVKASLHLSLNRAELLRNRSALPVGVVAMVVSKIDHPATWNMKILDKILCFGVTFGQASWMKCLANDDLDVREFPSQFQMGQFTISIELMARQYEGSWRCVPGFENSEMAQAIEKALAAGHHGLLLQINYQMYAIWKKQDFIYLLDPYRHRILGKPGEPEIYGEMEKSASLRMFRSFAVFLNSFNHILLDSNRSSKFYIHSLRIKNIQKRQKRAPEEVAKLAEDAEVKSLNEHVCFEESDDLCHKALAEISDYEDEDLLSEVDELELKTSSSEAEEALEEEEEAAGGGEEEELEGLESSSSGEDDEVLKKGKGGKAGRVKKGRREVQRRKGGKTGSTGKKGKGLDEANERKKAGETTDEEETNKKVKENKGSKSKMEEDMKKKAQDLEEEKAQRKKRDINSEKTSVDKDRSKGKEGKDGLEGMDKSGKEGKQIEASVDKDRGKEKEGKGGKDDMDKSGKEVKQNEDENKAEVEAAKKLSEMEKTGRNEKETDKAKDKHKEKEKELNKEENLEKDKDKDKNKEKDHKNPLREDNAQARDTPKADKETQIKSMDKAPKKTGCRHDGTEADDEQEHEDDFFRNAKRFCNAPNPNRYPGYFKCPLNMAVVGSENGSYDSLCKLLHNGFRRADRILAMTPWGNFVVFRCHAAQEQRHYYLFDGCTCNVNRFRHLDLSIGTAGLLCFQHMHDIIEYMRRIRKLRAKENRRERLTADEICRQYCR